MPSVKLYCLGRYCLLLLNISFFVIYGHLQSKNDYKPFTNGYFCRIPPIPNQPFAKITRKLEIFSPGVLAMIV